MDFKKFITPLILIACLALLAACSQQPVVKSRKAKRNIDPSEKLPVAFEIARVDDASHKATTKPISAYTSEKLAALPIAKKVIVKILVRGDIKRTQIRPTVQKIIAQLTEEDNDLDEIELFIFVNVEALDGSSSTEFGTTFDDTNSFRETINSKYDVAHASWHPGLMTRGRVTPALARSNERDDYETDIKVRENLEEYLEQKDTFKEDFALTELEKKAVYIDIIAAKNKAADKAGKKFPNNPKKAAKIRVDLEKQYYADLRAKHVVTDEMLEEITEEGKALDWPSSP